MTVSLNRSDSAVAEASPPLAEARDATRAEGLRRLAAFVPRAGRAYAEKRNYDWGPTDRSNVSGLSPWLRRRLIREDEVVRAVLARHSSSAAEKFIQEVCWRTYFKGWLERRPNVWRDFQAQLTADQSAVDADAELAADVQAALAGETGIAPFDHWARELITTGWLHNHARMWFASTWIFTLGLPWTLGAAFFYRHLLDADPASNTLSWRWVAGLHTRGKTYLARPDNIARYTGGRFEAVQGLATRAEPLDEPPVGAAWPMPDAAAGVASGPCLALVTTEDCHPESWAWGSVQPVAVTSLSLPAEEGGLLSAAPLRRAFDDAALEDAVTRASAIFSAPRLESPLATSQQDADTMEPMAERFAALAREAQAQQIVTAYAPVGGVCDQLDQLEPLLASRGVSLTRVRRAWDTAFWPYAAKGFFGLKANIPTTLQELAVH